MYRVVDYYEGKEVIGEYETREEAEQTVKDWEIDVDHECRTCIEEV